jgi:HAE1 family hydrophobic/amphiphilic exporter-1
MAQVMLGGLLSSTLLNAFVIPVMYILIEQRRDRRQQRRVVTVAENV